jgi:lantibiotic modifying enzyme
MAKMTARHAPTPLDSEAVRIARNLGIFLQCTPRHSLGKPGSPAQRSSIDRMVAPLATFAIARLRQKSRGGKGRMAKKVWEDLRQDILKRLVFALTPTLRFHQELTARVARGLKLAGPRHNDRNITLLESFTEFSGLPDISARLISSWIGAQLELFTRLFVDMEELSTVFFSKKRPLRVVCLRPGLSDPHDGGKTVTMIQFAEGRRIIYKPRLCDGELLWFEALRWLVHNGIQVDFRIPKILARRKYFWMEFLRKTDCKNAGQIRSFYFRWGVQAGLAQILGATDLHRDNWVPVGSQPILVDAELIGGAKVAPEEKASSDRYLPAVLSTGLLPIIARDGAGFYRGIAPFDEAVLKTAPASCWPRRRGTFEKPSRYVNELATGFKAVSDLFASRRIRKDFFNGVMLRIPRNVRVLPYATTHYTRLLRESLEAHHMMSSGSRRRYLDRECQATTIRGRIGRAEARALLRCDIPKFTTSRTLRITWRSFVSSIAELRRSSTMLRRRIMFGTGDSS